RGKWTYNGITYEGGGGSAAEAYAKRIAEAMAKG
nr:Chain A, MHB4A peptide [synthetic construct]